MHILRGTQMMPWTGHSTTGVLEEPVCAFLILWDLFLDLLEENPLLAGNPLHLLRSHGSVSSCTTASLSMKEASITV